MPFFLGKLFMLFSTDEKLLFMSQENISKSFIAWSTRTNKNLIASILVTHVEQRLIDIRKVIKRINCNHAEVFYAVNIFKLYDKCCEILGPILKESGEKIQRAAEKNKNFNNKRLVDFAISHQLTDPLTLMYEYAHLADPCDRAFYTKDHEDDHIEENDNAKIFVTLGDRKKCAKNAVDCVVAQLYAQLKSLTNTQWLEMRSREVGNRMLEESDENKVGEACYYLDKIIGRQNFRLIMKYVISAFMFNEPKKRFCALMGSYNCGKTTFAAAVCKFFEGVNINLNISKDRLPFYLGAAIGKRFVLFDDVKGRKFRYPPRLPTGPGLDNLDDLRDHLDGHIEVQLEKKNQNPVEQKFPCGIITMNRYILPPSLKKRVTIFPFKRSQLFDYHKYRVTMDTIYVGMVMDNLIPCEKEVLALFNKLEYQWNAKHLSCDCRQVSHLFFSMGGIISFAVAAAVPFVTWLFETAAQAAVLYLGTEGLISIAGAGLGALVEYSLPAALGVVAGAYSTAALSIAGATFGGALILGTVIGTVTGLTLTQQIGSIKPLVEQLKDDTELQKNLARPIVDYIDGFITNRRQLYSRVQSSSTMRVQRGQSNGLKPMLSTSPDVLLSRGRQQVLREKRKATPSRQVVRKTQPMRKKGRR